MAPDCSQCGSPLGADLSCIACRATSTAPDSTEAGDASPFRERRDRRRQRAIAGGSRSTDPPLTTRDCADWMGFTSEWVRAAIDEGVTVRGRVVKLEAETLALNGRRVHRIHLDRFVAFLTAIGWKRIPKTPRRAA